MSNEIAKPQKRPLAKLDDLYANKPLAAAQNELNRLLNNDPKPEWVKEHPFAKNVKYLPISVIEYLLTSIYLKWRVEVRDTKVVANSIVCTVRLHVQDPITMEWDWQDGVGATPIQTEKGAAATDFNKVLTDAVMKSAPAAESYAIKDAAEKLGRLFGKDLNRKDWLAYTNLEGKLDLNAIDYEDKPTFDQIQYLWGLLDQVNFVERKEAGVWHAKVQSCTSKQDAAKYIEQLKGMIPVDPANVKHFANKQTVQ